MKKVVFSRWVPNTDRCGKYKENRKLTTWTEEYCCLCETRRRR